MKRGLYSLPLLKATNNHRINRNWDFCYLDRRGKGKHKAQVNGELQNPSSLVRMAALLTEDGWKIEIPFISSSEVVNITK